MDDLKTKIKNTQSILMELINLLENNSIDANSLKNTYQMFEITKDDKVLEDLVIWVSKLLNSTMNELKESNKKIIGIKNKTNEKIDNYNDSKESEELINNI